MLFSIYRFDVSFSFFISSFSEVLTFRGISFFSVSLVKDFSGSEALYILTEFKLSNFINLSLNVLKQNSDNLFYLTGLFGIIFISILLSIYILVKRQFSLRYLLVLCIVFFTFISQYFLFYKVGFTERYLFPTNLAVMLFFSFLLVKINQLNKSLYFSSIITIIFFTIFQLKISYKHINTYVDEGKNIELYIGKINSLCKGKCNLLLVGDKLVNLEMFQALIEYGLYTNSDLNINISPLPTNIKNFKNLSKTEDLSLLPVIELFFDNYYEKYLKPKNKDLIDYDLIIYVGYGIQNFKEKSQLKEIDTFGKEWYEFHFFKP